MWNVHVQWLLHIDNQLEGGSVAANIVPNQQFDTLIIKVIVVARRILSEEGCAPSIKLVYQTQTMMPRQVKWSSNQARRVLVGGKDIGDMEL